MQAGITIALNGASTSASPVFVAIGNAQLVLSANAGMSGSFGSGITNLAIAGGRVAIASGQGAILDINFDLTITWQQGDTPTVTLENVSTGANPPTVQWPTVQGREQQILSPGIPMTLAGIAG